MPAPIVPALIAGGAAIAGSGINAIAQGKINKRTMRYNTKMYKLQRQHALEDWAMQNEYNHPTSVMSRLREAGLNPHLVYGEGANMPSVNVRSSEVGSWNPKAAEWNIGEAAVEGIHAYQNWEVKEAQVDNLRAQNTVHIQDALLKAAQVIDTTESGKTKEFDRQLKQDLREYSVEAARLGVTKQKADIDYTLDQNERAAAMTGANLKESAERILNYRLERAKTAEEIRNIKLQAEILKKDATLKQLDIDLKKLGIQPTDPAYMRILSRLFNSVDNMEYQESSVGGHEKADVDSLKKRLEMFKFKR